VQIVVPLFLGDKVNLVESYLAGRPELQCQFVAFLDTLCDNDFDVMAYVE
jgi:hypothetical protein